MDKSLSFGSTTKAVFIGTSTSPNDEENLPPLPHVVNNISDLIRLFKDPDVIGLDDSSIVKILDEDEATAVLGKVVDAARAATDTLLVYYAGHGLYGDAKEPLYLVAKNSTSEKKAFNAIPMSKLRQAITESPARRRILILDCCYSGSVFAGAMASNNVEDAIKQSISLEGTYGVAAAPANHKALAPPGKRLTAFTEQLVDVLDNGLPDKGSTLTLGDVFGEVRARLHRKANMPVPEVVNWKDVGQFRFAKNRYGKAKKTPDGRAESDTQFVPDDAEKDYGSEGESGLNQLSETQILEFHETELASDRAETTRDRLGRAPLAFALAHHINRIWTEQTNPVDKGNGKHAPDEAAFILHIDSPWGGGKTTFANFVSRILHPQGHDLDPRIQGQHKQSLFADLRLDDEEYWPNEYGKRKWITVTFNAWQHQHVTPPWWNFYESIRKQCLSALPFGERCGNRISEWMWRVWSPEIRRTLTVMALIALFVWFLSSFESIQFLLFGKANDQTNSTSAGNEILLLVLALTGGSGVALLTSFRSGVRKIVDSAGTSTDKGALGEADPLQRFRRHFTNAIRRYARPVLVIVDDLDRCEPKYVVELMRGMLTIFHSPRVVFVLLGDKSWIETSFAIVHKEMANAQKDSNISFGRRFAEKAIQLSFILPEPDKASRDAYIDYLLLGNDAEEAKPNSLNRPGDAGKASSEQVLGAARETAPSPQPDQDKLFFNKMQAFESETKDLFRGAKSGTERKAVLETLRSSVRELFGNSQEAQRVAEQIINREAALRAASSERTEVEIRHGISDIKNELPDNPRRIKRIINMIAVYQASAQAVLGVDPGTDGWRKLVLWIIMMSEHPEGWRILSERPDLADKVIDGKTGREGEQPATSTKENPEVKWLATLNREAIARLIKGEAFTGETVHLDTEAVSWLRRLTPLP